MVGYIYHGIRKKHQHEQVAFVKVSFFSKFFVLLPKG